jgi:hypothetical protein
MEDSDRADRAAVQHEMQRLYDEATALVADNWPTPDTMTWGTGCGDYADGTPSESWNIANQYKGPTKSSPQSDGGAGCEDVDRLRVPNTGR